MSPTRQTERERAIAYLEQTHAQFLVAISGLSQEQWRYKPSPECWSPGEVAEHLAVIEGNVLALIQNAASGPEAAVEEVAAIEDKGGILVRMVSSRGRKVQTPEAGRPANRWAEAAEVIVQFTERRNRTIAYARSAGDELCTRIAPHFVLGPLSCQHWLLFLGAHAERHLKQVDEVKADAGYPKSS